MAVVVAPVAKVGVGAGAAVEWVDWGAAGCVAVAVSAAVEREAAKAAAAALAVLEGAPAERVMPAVLEGATLLVLLVAMMQDRVAEKVAGTAVGLGTARMVAEEMAAVVVEEQAAVVRVVGSAAVKAAGERAAGLVAVRAEVVMGEAAVGAPVGMLGAASQVEMMAPAMVAHRAATPVVELAVAASVAPKVA